MYKLKNDDTSITLGALNNICNILDMQPKDILEFVQTEEEKKELEKIWKYLFTKRQNHGII